MLKVCFPPHQEMKVQPTDPTGSTSASRDSFRGSLWAWFIYNCAVGCSRWWPHMASIASTAVEHMQWRNPSTVNEATVKGAMWPPPRWCLCCADPPAKPPLRLRCRQGRFYKWKRESFHFTPTPSSLYCENLLCAGRNHIISTHTLDICHYATRCCNKTSNWIVLKTVKFGGAGRGGGGNALQESRSVRASWRRWNSQEESTQLGVTYREFRGCSTFTTVAEEPVLWALGSLRHLHGEAQRLTSERQPLNGSALWVTHN